MKTIAEKTKSLEWRVNTASLMERILEIDAKGPGIMLRPIQIFAGILYEVGARAAEINDPQLNKLMARLSIYSQTDPYSEDYSEEITQKLLA